MTKSDLIPLGLTAAAATDAGIHKKILGSGTTTLSASFLANMLTCQEIVRTVYGNKNGKRIIRSGYGFVRSSIKKDCRCNIIL